MTRSTLSTFLIRLSSPKPCSVLDTNIIGRVKHPASGIRQGWKWREEHPEGQIGSALARLKVPACAHRGGPNNCSSFASSTI